MSTTVDLGYTFIVVNCRYRLIHGPAYTRVYTVCTHTWAVINGWTVTDSCVCVLGAW